MEIFVSLAAVACFAFFVWRRVKAIRLEREARALPPARPRPPVDPDRDLR